MEKGILNLNNSLLNKIFVDKDNVSKRLDLFLFQNFNRYSRTFFKNLIESKKVFVNGSIITKSSYSLRLNDIVEFSFPDIKLLISKDLVNVDIGVKIIYQNNDFIIVYKPAGLMVHKPTIQSDAITLVDWLVSNFSELENVGATDRPGIVHRLDKDTSGLLIIPRNNEAHIKFSNMFKNRRIEKVYLAIVNGHPEKSGVINYNISRHNIYKNRMNAVKDNSYGRESVTYYKVLNYFNDYSLLEIMPITGRTHQIRVHLSSINFPIVGDSLYASQSKFIKRQALHAYKISFVYEDILYSFAYDMPEDMKILTKL